MTSKTKILILICVLVALGVAAYFGRGLILKGVLPRVDTGIQKDIPLQKDTFSKSAFPPKALKADLVPVLQAVKTDDGLEVKASVKNTSALDLLKGTPFRVTFSINGQEITELERVWSGETEFRGDLTMKYLFPISAYHLQRYGLTAPYTIVMRIDTAGAAIEESENNEITYGVK